MDVVASLYGRNHLHQIIINATKNIFIPITVGGGIRSVEDAKKLLRSGADKIALNTAAVANPNLIYELANEFGNQCVVLSIEAKKVKEDTWEAFTNNGREPSGLNVIEWAEEAVSRGAGEILVTSVDREGTRTGFDINLIKQIASKVRVPVIASGGMGKPKDLVSVVVEGRADAVSMADILHYERFKIGEIREFAKNNGLEVRDF
jgi:cyclase